MRWAEQQNLNPAVVRTRARDRQERGEARNCPEVREEHQVVYRNGTNFQGILTQFKMMS